MPFLNLILDLALLLEIDEQKTNSYLKILAIKNMQSVDSGLAD